MNKINELCNKYDQSGGSKDILFDYYIENPSILKSHAYI